MKKILTLIFLALFCVPGADAQFTSKNDSVISLATSLINQDSVGNRLQWLQDMGTRFLMAPNHKEVANKIKACFESYGMTEVRLDSFECYTNINYSILHYDTTTWQYNVEAKIIGSVYPDIEILVMGHYDNVQLNSNPELFAPGADDDGSGTVAVLETARVLMEMGYQPEKTLVFLATAAEELMNFGDAGSEHYAAEASSAGRNLWAVINNDMIAYDEGTNMIGFSNVIGSEEITGIAALITENYTSLSADIPSPQANSGADLKPFIDAGYSGIYLEEYIFNPFYHTEQDLVENCDLPYLTEVIKISCGSMIYSDISVGIHETQAENISIHVWPNPCRDRINILMEKDNEPVEITLLNTSGQVVRSISSSQSAGIVSLDVADLPSGVYFMKLTGNGSVRTAKVVKK